LLILRKRIVVERENDVARRFVKFGRNWIRLGAGFENLMDLIIL